MVRALGRGRGGGGLSCRESFIAFGSAVEKVVDRTICSPGEGRFAYLGDPKARA